MVIARNALHITKGIRRGEELEALLAGFDRPSQDKIVKSPSQEGIRRRVQFFGRKYQIGPFIFTIGISIVMSLLAISFYQVYVSKPSRATETAIALVASDTPTPTPVPPTPMLVPPTNTPVPPTPLRELLNSDLLRLKKEQEMNEELLRQKRADLDKAKADLVNAEEAYKDILEKVIGELEQEVENLEEDNRDKQIEVDNLRDEIITVLNQTVSTLNTSNDTLNQSLEKANLEGNELLNQAKRQLFQERIFGFVSIVAAFLVGFRNEIKEWFERRRSNTSPSEEPEPTEKPTATEGTEPPKEPD